MHNISQGESLSSSSSGCHFLFYDYQWLNSCVIIYRTFLSFIYNFYPAFHSVQMTFVAASPRLKNLATTNLPPPLHSARPQPPQQKTWRLVPNPQEIWRRGRGKTVRVQAATRPISRVEPTWESRVIIITTGPWIRIIRHPRPTSRPDFPPNSRAQQKV